MAWYSYRNAREEKEGVLREIERRRRKGEPFVAETPATPRGALAVTFWGKAWCANLESYADYEYRLPRGRHYLRNGNVYDLELSTGRVFACVAGSSLYEVEAVIDPLPRARWRKLSQSLAGEIGNLVDLLAGRLGPGVMKTVVEPRTGLFPAPSEIHIRCTCPDWANFCKHSAATLYAIGARLDKDPALLFLLRGVDPQDLLTAASAGVARLADPAPSDPASGVLDPGSLAELFGIDLAEPEAAFGSADPAPPAGRTGRRPAARRTRKRS